MVPVAARRRRVRRHPARRLTGPLHSPHRRRGTPGGATAASERAQGTEAEHTASEAQADHHGDAQLTPAAGQRWSPPRVQPEISGSGGVVVASTGSSSPCIGTLVLTAHDPTPPVHGCLVFSCGRSSTSTSNTETDGARQRSGRAPMSKTGTTSSRQTHPLPSKGNPLFFPGMGWSSSSGLFGSPLPPVRTFGLRGFRSLCGRFSCPSSHFSVQPSWCST